MKWITIGDKVNVYFEFVSRVSGTIIAMSDEEVTLAEYLLKDENGQLHQIMHYSHMEKIDDENLLDKDFPSVELLKDLLPEED